MIEAEPTCKDFGDRPGCLGTPDPRYTMDFSDIGEDPILWCSHCGPDAHAMSEALVHAMETRGPEFHAQLSDAVSKAKAEQEKKVS